MSKNASRRDIPPPLELECLKALWQVGSGTVKDVRGVVTESRNLAYTTVMTVLDRLEKRGSVERKKVGRSFVYTPVLGKEELRRLAVGALLDTFFDGSTEELIRFLDGRSAEDSDPEPVDAESPIEPVVPQSLNTELL
jgi:predicted transcriptional regulator